MSVNILYTFSTLPCIFYHSAILGDSSELSIVIELFAPGIEMGSATVLKVGGRQIF